MEEPGHTAEQATEPVRIELQLVQALLQTLAPRVHGTLVEV